jgi:hypothetical protein
MEQDFTKISSNPIACIKIDSPNSIHDFSGKGLKKMQKEKEKPSFFHLFRVTLYAAQIRSKRWGWSTDLQPKD